jgi:hypothetical protein
MPVLFHVVPVIRCGELRRRSGDRLGAGWLGEEDLDVHVAIIVRFELDDA